MSDLSLLNFCYVEQMNILKNLQAEVETRTAEHQREIEEKNRSLDKVRVIILFSSISTEQAE